MWVGQAQRATASGERIFEVMDEPEGVDDRPGAVELAAGPGAIRFERVGFGYAEGRPVLHEIELEIGAGPNGRADRPHRLGQDDARRARAALLRRDRGPRARRRRRRPRRDAPLAPARDRRHLAGPVPLLGDRAREHRVRRPRRDRRAGRAGGARCAGARVRRGAAAGLRHGDRRARDHALGRPAAAARDRAGARHRPAHPDPRRRDRLGRRDDRGARSAPASPRRCAAGRRSSSRTASRRSRSPTRSSCSTTAASSPHGTQAELLATSAGLPARSTSTGCSRASLKESA